MKRKLEPEEIKMLRLAREMHEVIARRGRSKAVQRALESTPSGQFQLLMEEESKRAEFRSRKSRHRKSKV